MIASKPNRIERVKNIVKGRLCEYYEALERVDDIEQHITELRQDYSDIHAVRYDRSPEEKTTTGMTRDQLMVHMTSTIMDLENEQRFYLMKANRLKTELHLDDLTQTEKRVLEAVYSTRTYEDAGERTGYSVKQIYRIMCQIYHEMERYI